MYFNEYDFNNNADGIRSAARIYFGKEPKDLKIEEGAMLVGMFKNSSLYNPIKNPQGVLNRRNVVLAQMEKNRFITTKEKDSLQQIPLELNFNPESHNEGIATYFREYLRSYMKKWIDENPKPDGSKYNIYADIGLILLRLSRESNISSLKQSGLVAIESATISSSCIASLNKLISLFVSP